MSLGDPRLKGMNDTQWLFELEAMNLQDKERYDDLKLMSEVVKKQVISMLGLNLLPVEDEETGLLRQPKEHECLPLALLMGREEVVMAIKERQEAFRVQEEVRSQLQESGESLGSSESENKSGVVEMSPEELEEFMKDEGDAEFENAPEEVYKALNWGGKGTQFFLENLVLAKEDLGDDPLEEKPVRKIGEARQDLKASLRKPSAAHPIEVEEVDLTPTKPTAVNSNRPIVTLDIK